MFFKNEKVLFRLREQIWDRFPVYDKSWLSFRYKSWLNCYFFHKEIEYFQ